MSAFGKAAFNQLSRALDPRPDLYPLINQFTVSMPPLALALARSKQTRRSQKGRPVSRRPSLAVPTEASVAFPRIIVFVAAEHEHFSQASVRRGDSRQLQSLPKLCPIARN